MQYILGGLVIFAFLYYFWPFVILGLACIAGYLWYKRISRNNNILKISESIPRLRETLNDLYLVSPNHGITFGRITDVCIGGLNTPGMAGRESLDIRIDTIYGEEHVEADRHLQYRAKSTNMAVMPIESLPTNYEFETIWACITNFLESNQLSPLPPDSLDAKVCSIIFSNYPEAEWADEAINRIVECITPLEKAYNASLTNELLAGNSKSLRRSLDILEREYQEIAEYKHEAELSIRKCAEFLSIPANLRNFTEYDFSTLEVGYRSKEIRESFQEVLAIKHEYDRLRE